MASTAPHNKSRPEEGSSPGQSSRNNGSDEVVIPGLVFTDDKPSDNEQAILSSAVDDDAAIPQGTIDPVYEAKARILNHAVGTCLII